MATKVIRTCDRLGCAIDMVPFSPGEELPSRGTVGYSILKTVTDDKGRTNTEILVDFDEVCSDCSEQIEGFVGKIKGEKRKVGRPRKDETVQAAPEPAKKADKPATGKRRGRKSNAQKAAEAAAAAEAASGVVLPETVDEEDEVDAVLERAVTMAATSSLLEDDDSSEVSDVDTFETDTGEVVNADTGEVIASPVDGEDVEEDDYEDTEISAPSYSNAHPF